VVQSPANASFTAASGSCSGIINAVPGAAVAGVTGGNIASGSTCELSVDVTTNAIGALNNLLSPGAVTSAQGQSSVNSASATLLSSGNADVAVIKDDITTSVIAGNSSNYTIIITNNSSALTVAGLPVNDPEPGDMQFTSWTCSALAGSSCAVSSGTGPIASSVTLAPLGTATFNVLARVSPDSLLASITNTVTTDPAAAGVFDPVSINNSASDTNAVTQSADVGITKTISSPNPQVGSTVTFLVTAINNGPSTARNVNVTDVLESGYSLDSATPSAGSYTAPIWGVGDISPAANETLTILAAVNAAGNYENTATITASSADPVSANNSATVSPATVGLRIEKSSKIISDPVSSINPKAIPGAIVEYRIRVWNEGTAPIDTNSIIVEDRLPDLETFVATGSGPPLTFIDGSRSSGLTYNYATNVSWTNALGGGAPYSYLPVPNGDGFDEAVTGFRINMQGIMAAGSVANPSSFEIVYRARVQ
jgi:large repetitive protein